MNYASDKHGSKSILLVLMVLGIYLAFFQFDVEAAWAYAIKQYAEFFALF